MSQYNNLSMVIKMSFDRLLYCEYSSRFCDLVVSINCSSYSDQISGCYIIDLLITMLSEIHFYK
jgi:hypothetical protein